MNSLFWIILIASLIILIALIVTLYVDELEGVKISIVLISFIILFSIVGLINKAPTAIDVYQEKTTLKYTVVDGVKIDSTVVWKKN